MVFVILSDVKFENGGFTVEISLFVRLSLVKYLIFTISCDSEVSNEVFRDMATSQDCYRSLLKVIWETTPQPSTSKNKSRYDCDEVYPGIFIGDEITATAQEYLKSVGITHVINTAQGNRIAQVDTNEHFYESSGIKFLGLQLMDTPDTNISLYFDECADFIDEALISGGKVFVHCYMGVSRSATIVLAYLMLRKGFTAEDAIRAVRKHRDVTPNDGFLQQLFDLNIRLRTKL